MSFTQSPRMEIDERRRVEDGLLRLGELRGQIEATDELNRPAIRSWIEPARRAGMTVREIARLTHFSTQTLHAWMRETMKPVAWAHRGLHDPAPESLEEAVVRTMADEPTRTWLAGEIRNSMPAGWPTGSTHEIQMALDMLARSGQLWRHDEGGFQIADPDPAARVEPPE